MGATESKSTSSSSFSSRAVVPVKKPKSTADHTTAPSIELMITLINAGIIPSIGLIIMGYATPSLQETSPFNHSNPSQFFTSKLSYICFSYNFSELAEADQHCIWGRPEEVKKILEKIKTQSAKDRDPLSHLKLLLATTIDGEDHRGAGFIPSGTLLQRSIYVGDVLNEDEKSGETMAEMVGRYVIEICGKEEFKRQLEPVLRVMEEEDQKKAAIEADDKEALNKVWNILKNANKKTLESNEELKTALDEFENQLRKPGNEKIIQEAEKLFDRDYREFENHNVYKNFKNNFAKNRIIGLAQLRRLSISDLQICFRGLNYTLKSNPAGKVIAKRIDVRGELGVLSAGVATYSLGSNCHLDVHVYGPLLQCWAGHSSWNGAANGFRFLEYLCQLKAWRFKKLCSHSLNFKSATLVAGRKPAFNGLSSISAN